MTADARKLLLAAIAMGMVMVGPNAQAQKKGQVEPARVSETYAAWTLHCRMVRSPATKNSKKKEKEKAKKVCEVAQIYLHKKTRRELARLVFTQGGDKKKGYVGILRVLVDVSFDKAPSIVMNDKELVKGKFVRCFARNCYALFNNIQKKQIDAMQKAKKLSVRYPLANGRILSLSIQLQGFAEAMNAMAKK